MDYSGTVACSRRGAVVEAVYTGTVSVRSAAAGQATEASGDITALRSCVKPLQALVFLRDAAGEIGATSEDIAIACASHNGEPVHVEAVRSLLARAGVGEDALACGPQPPMDAGSAARLVAEGRTPLPIHNNCSGKHAAMLATCAVRGWPAEGYTQFDHPLQAAIRAAMSDFLHVDLESAPTGVDGCGIPTYGVPLPAVARAFAEAQADPAFRRAQEAMAAHPHLVAGRGRFDTALLEAFGERATSKVGGAAIWAGCVRPDGPGVAVKIAAGVDSAVAPVALAVLQGLGAVESTGPGGSLAEFERPLVRNWAGQVVGEVVVESALRHAFDREPPAS